MNVERHVARRTGDGKGLKLEFCSQDFQRGTKNLFLFRESPWDLYTSPVILATTRDMKMGLAHFSTS
jgi:hypothetical protein